MAGTDSPDFADAKKSFGPRSNGGEATGMADDGDGVANKLGVTVSDDDDMEVSRPRCVPRAGEPKGDEGGETSNTDEAGV